MAQCSADSYSDRSSTAVERRCNRGSRAGSSWNWVDREESRIGDESGTGEVVEDVEAGKDSNRTAAEGAAAAAAVD